MNKKIESSCGAPPQNSSFDEIIPNDGNFIFENDPLYETIVLYDQDGNIVNVNSWSECSHYIKGGWSIADPNSLQGLNEIFLGVSILFFIYILVRKFYLSNVE